MSEASVWRTTQRVVSLGFLHASELILRLAGRRGPFGILKLDLGGNLTEGEEEQRLLGLLRRPADDYLNAIALLRWAREDPRLTGVLIRCDGLHIGWSRLQGLRRGVERLREAGKRVWFHLNQAGIHEYYLASAAERVALAPAASVDVTGLSSEAIFFLGALEKLGVQADVVQMGRYKAAAEMFTRRDMSVPHREMMESLVDDLYDQIIDAVAASRGLEPGAVRSAFDGGPLLPAEAVAARLIDDLKYEDEVETSLVDACGGAKVIERHDYAKRRWREVRMQVLRRLPATLGLLHVNGTIKGGDSVPGPEGASAAGVSTVAAALKDFRESDDIKAVVIRIASPGGSGVASDLIWREIARTREKKPVVVSLGDVAASGGYYAAVAGAPVLAEAGTITGSIGVVAGKANLRGLYDRIGVTKELVQRGRHAAIYSDYAPLGAEERERIQAEAQRFYDDFVDKVATARNLTREAVAAVAEGRVWTGRQAWTRGLVDELGGMEEALDAAKKLIGLPVTEAVALDRQPWPRRLWKLSLGLHRPEHGRLFDFFSYFPHLRFVQNDHVWAILPFDLRFF